MMVVRMGPSSMAKVGAYSSRDLHRSHRHAGLGQQPFTSPTVLLAKMEDAGREHGIGLALAEHIDHVLHLAAPPLAMTGMVTASLTDRVKPTS